MCLFAFPTGRAAEPWFQAIPMVRAAARLGRVAAVPAGERVRRLPAGRLPVDGQPVAEEQAQAAVEPQPEAAPSHHVLTVELPIRHGPVAGINDPCSGQMRAATVPLRYPRHQK